MFNIVKGLQTSLQIEPNYLDLLRDPRFILEQIKQRVEGKFFESEGYVILVTNWLSADTHKMDLDEAFIEEDGSVRFKVSFEAITFNLRKNDIIDCICTGCDVMCVNAKLGPVDIVISRKEMPTNYEFSQIVYNKFLKKKDQCFKDQDHQTVMQVGTKLRVQIVNTRYKNGLKAVGKLAGEKINDVCGPLDDELRL